MKTYCWFALLAASTIASAAQAHHRTVKLSGVAYTFTTPYPLAGATISIAEHPELSTTSDAHGRYALAVPDEDEITPVVSSPGYRTMYLQTFETEGEDLDRVFAQMVPLQTYDFLAAMLGIDPDGPSCNVVSTVSVAAIQGLSFEQFVAFSPQGQEGATVSSRPELGPPIYFDTNVLPDPSLTTTSSDGGVLFLDVPPGRHTLRASAPHHRFAKVVAICAPGRFINASPPWGLWEKK